MPLLDAPVALEFEELDELDELELLELDELDGLLVFALPVLLAAPELLEPVIAVVPVVLPLAAPELAWPVDGAVLAAVVGAALAELLEPESPLLAFGSAVPAAAKEV